MKIKVPNTKTGGGEEGATLLSNQQWVDGAVRYGQTPQDGAVVVTMPARLPMTDPPTTYIIPAILAMVFCWYPIGRKAMQHGQRCNEAIYTGDRAGANQHSAKAKKLTIMSTIIGLVFNFSFLTLFILLMYFGVIPSPGNIFGKNQKLIWHQDVWRDNEHSHPTINIILVHLVLKIDAFIMHDILGFQIF